MGVDIHLILCKYNPEDNLYHELNLYRKENNEYEKVYLFSGRNSEMFSIMCNEDEDIYGHFPCTNIAFNSLDEELKEEIFKEEYCYGFKEVFLSDLEYYLKDYPTIVDYDEDWDNWKPGDPKPQKTNPLKYLYDDCCSYAKFSEGWCFGIDPYSRYKLLYWFG